MKDLLFSTALLLRSHNANGTTLDDFSQHAQSAAGRHIINQLIDAHDSYEASVLLSHAADELRKSSDAEDAARCLAGLDVAFHDYLLAEVTYCFFKREGDLETVLYELDHEAKDRVIRGVALYRANGGAS